MAPEKFAYIETFGCQMNERDSEIMGQLLRNAAYLPTRELARADLVLINTCSVRAKAEQKVFSLLGRLQRLKQKKPGMIIAVAGCVAQQEGKNIAARMPQVDIVLGTQNIYRLPELVARAADAKKTQVAIELKPSFRFPQPLPSPDIFPGASANQNPYRRFVTIMQGCNNFCSYCVVPFTRGREVSRPFSDIIEEISALAAAGVKEITLLGQNVNSYGSGAEDFPALLRAVAGIAGPQRLRFTTSHPKDLSTELMNCFADIDILCPNFHLPVQSGSNRILQLMNRGYTIESYLEKIKTMRQIRPDLALSTDIIVGFPGETDEDFEATLELLETVRFHSAFSFKYSDRPNARSVRFDNKVPEAVKGRRLARLQALQNEISLARNREYVGSRMQLLIEGKSKAAEDQYSGRTVTNQVVNFPADEKKLQPGDFALVEIVEGCQHSLRGKLI